MSLRLHAPTHPRWCVFAAIASLALAACSAEEPRFRVVADSDRRQDTSEPATPSEEHPEHGPEVAQASRAAEDVGPTDALPPPLGRTLTVGAESASRSDLAFTRDQLGEALRQLGPGDRLILGPGVYEGPLRIDDTMQDGRRPEPIQVVARKDAVLTISDKRSTASAVLEVQRSFWEFHGLEIVSPQTVAAGIALDQVKRVLLADCHIHDLGGAGIRLGERVQEVVLEQTHIHQIGIGRGKTGAFGIVVTDPRSRLIVSSSQIHHTHLAPISLPDGSIRRLEDAERWPNVELQDSEIK